MGLLKMNLFLIAQHELRLTDGWYTYNGRSDVVLLSDDNGAVTIECAIIKLATPYIKISGKR